MGKVLYDIYKVKNVKSPVNGRFFGRVVPTETMDTEGLAQHIAEHGSVFTEDVVNGVLDKARRCILELLLDSKKVKLNGLGTFYLSAHNRKGGADTLEDFSVTKNIQGLHIRFLPDQSDSKNLSAKTLFQKANFKWAEELKRESAESKPDPGALKQTGRAILLSLFFMLFPFALHWRHRLFPTRRKNTPAVRRRRCRRGWAGRG
jgi:predicted histone-like DNA-binding protein